MAIIPQCGIYQIEGPGGCVYIGSAANIRRRWVFHQSLLRRGIHHAPHIQNTYNKYGSDSLRFSILEHVSDPSDLERVEQVWLDILFTSLPRHLVYNVCRYAGSVMGRKQSPETLAKLSAWRKGRKKSDETRKRMSEGRKGMKFAAGHVDNIALGKSGGKRYTVVAPDGTAYHDVTNLSAFAAAHGLIRSGLRCIACGQLKSHKGWTLYLQPDTEELIK